MRAICSRASLLTLVLFSFYYGNLALKQRHSISQRNHCKKLFASPYSPTELSNLKTITDKKLGPKLGQDYLLVTTIVKASQSRSEILDCVAQSDIAGDEVKRLKVKIVKEQDRFDREYKNYQVRPSIIRWESSATVRQGTSPAAIQRHQIRIINWL